MSLVRAGIAKKMKLGGGRGVCVWQDLLFLQTGNNEADWGFMYVAAGCAIISNTEKSQQENFSMWTRFAVAVITAFPSTPCITCCMATALTLSKVILLNQAHFKTPKEWLYYKCEVFRVMCLHRQYIFSSYLRTCMSSIFYCTYYNCWISICFHFQ